MGGASSLWRRRGHQVNSRPYPSRPAFGPEVVPPRAEVHLGAGPAHLRAAPARSRGLLGLPTPCLPQRGPSAVSLAGHMQVREGRGLWPAGCAPSWASRLPMLLRVAHESEISKQLQASETVTEWGGMARMEAMI